ncbi:MAG: LPS-assembly protein LptD [Nitrospinae bacterium]|nr:LPS-assembly protein LptD [Nitrospinota bacterium]
MQYKQPKNLPSPMIWSALQAPFSWWPKLKNVFKMKKTLLILGILLTIANDASASDRPPSISPDSQNLISSSPQDQGKLADVSDRVYSDDEVILTESGYKIVPGYIPNWIWADGTPLTPEESEILDSKLAPPQPDSTPDWFWADGKPLSPSEKTKMPKGLNYSEWVQKINYGTGTGKINKPEKNLKKDEVFIIADHMRQNIKKEIIWTWGNVKIRMENKTIQADKVKINNKTGEGIAKGHVMIRNNDGTRLKANSSRFNIKNQKGKIFQTRGRLGKRHYIKGREVTRLSDDHYKGKSVSLTTCTGKLPDWLFEAETMDIITGDRAVFTGGVLKIRDIPVLYVPAGYLPMNRERKSGFLFPSFGSSDIDGTTINNEYYWAINDHSDATFKLGYRSKRGVTPGIEYRYTPSKTTNGFLTGTVVDDNITGETFWKVDAQHNQELPYGFIFNGKLDLEGQEYNKTFNDNINLRNRRNSLSYATARKTWGSGSFEILTRFRDSTDISSDQTLGELPQITYKVQRQQIGDSPYYFNQDTLFTSFVTDLNSDPDIDDNFSVQRLDFHPQLTRAINIAPWLSLTPTIGLRETLYSKGKNGEGFFSRESFDFTSTLKGPTFEKIFETKNNLTPKIKHLVEPRLTFSYIPDLDREDKGKIQAFDAIDSVNPRSLLTYSITQRLFQKEATGKGDFDTRESLRFVISQSYDLREASRTSNPERPNEPFSDIRFDLDSRLADPLLLNFDSTYDINDRVLKQFNLQLGFRPMEALTLYFERRFTRRGDVTSMATLDWDFLKGWNFKASTRLDEKTATHRETNLSILYDDPCKCWGFNADFIQRNNFNSTSSTSAGAQETRFLLGITFRGLGSIQSGTPEKFIHRSFDPLR